MLAATCVRTKRRQNRRCRYIKNSPSEVMKEMNSDTHSCMHSLASLAIFAFSGRAFFMIRATGAKFRMLASNWSYLSPLEEAGRAASGDFGDETWDMDE